MTYGEEDWREHEEGMRWWRERRRQRHEERMAWQGMWRRQRVEVPVPPQAEPPVRARVEEGQRVRVDAATDTGREREAEEEEAADEPRAGRRRRR